MEVNYIKCCDCVDGMRELPDCCIDLTVTSPPYDDLRKYKGFEWDFEETAKELFRVTKEGGVVVWVVGDATKNGSESGTSFKQALRFKEIGFNLHDTMIYEKAQACFGSRLCYLQSFEYMFVFSKGRPKTLNLIYDRPNRRPGTESAAVGSKRKNEHGKLDRVTKTFNEFGKRKNIWKYAVGGGKTGHPAVFPEKLAQDHILSWSKEGDVVFDPFVGSGTTAKMAKELGRNYIGFDCAEEYCDMALKRINGAKVVV